MLTLYDNPFSPFARKVRLVLAHKGLEVVCVDALALAHHDELRTLNPRGEVPALVDGDLTVVNSSDIVAYLEHCHPSPPVFPSDPRQRVAARAWERIADSVLDAIIHDISIWTWPTHRRTDAPPPGLIEVGCRDITTILARMETALEGQGFLCRTLSIADLACFPHVSSLKPLGIGLDATHYPRLCDWNQRMRSLAIVQADLEYVKRLAREKFVDGPSPYESEKIVWRGDRLEWLFHNGFVAWWHAEYQAGRAVVPAPL
jgi:glutathione S-transferase